MVTFVRGGFPAEMGPKIYDELEALKAQAIAARTYAARNMGQCRREGNDTGAGPACQAYGGVSREEALPERAGRETAGLVATYNGQPIDALYTAACGGETSDVGTMFPGRSEPYLKRVRCIEDEVLTIAGRADSGLLTEQQVNARLFAAIAGLPEAGTSWSARDVSQAGLPYQVRMPARRGDGSGGYERGHAARGALRSPRIVDSQARRNQRRRRKGGDRCRPRSDAEDRWEADALHVAGKHPDLPQDQRSVSGVSQRAGDDRRPRHHHVGRWPHAGGAGHQRLPRRRVVRSQLH